MASLARAESDLYPPVKTFLEGQGYAVKSEIHGCDVVATRGDEPPVVVELKLRFSLELVLQAVDRLSITEKVYVAFSDGPRTTWRKRSRSTKKLCRMLGIGVLIIRRRRNGTEYVHPELDPEPYRPRQSGRRHSRLLKEFAHRVGDPNLGGINRRPLMTAYRQDALRLVDELERAGELAIGDLRQATGVDRAAAILQRNVYGWFERARRGVYRLSPKGRAAKDEFAVR